MARNQPQGTHAEENRPTRPSQTRSALQRRALDFAPSGGVAPRAGRRIIAPGASRRFHSAAGKATISQPSPASFGGASRRGGGFWAGNQHRRHKVGAFRVLGGGWGRLAPGDWNQRGDGNQHRRHELGPFCVKGGGGIWNRHGKTRMGVILCHRGPSIHPVVIGAQPQGPRVRMIRVPA